MAPDAAPSFVWAERLPADGEIELGPEESRYVSRVCRARVGERLHATDGRGLLAELEVRRTGRAVTARVLSTRRRERPGSAWIACGPPEGERADWLVEKLAELGIAAFQPLDCERARWRPIRARADRWRRLARAALRQSRQAWEMEIRDPLALEDLPGVLPPGAALRLAEPTGAPWIGPAPDVAFAVGPASGFTEAEKRLLLGAGFEAISLGPSRLRAETAALCAAALWAAGSARVGSDVLTVKPHLP